MMYSLSHTYDTLLLLFSDALHCTVQLTMVSRTVCRYCWRLELTLTCRTRRESQLYTGQLLLDTQPLLVSYSTLVYGIDIVWILVM